jgi:protease I
MPVGGPMFIYISRIDFGQRGQANEPLTKQGVLTMTEKLKGKKVAIVATDGFEQVELTEPKKALEAAGATVEVISLKPGEIKGWKFTDWGDITKVDKTLDQAKPADYDALVLPGGQINPDKLRIEPKAVAFVADFFNSGKPIGAICHGPWLLVEAGVVKKRTLTSWPSVRTDIRNAGGHWVDEEVVTDQNLTTSRKPDDLPAFNERLIRELSQGKLSQTAHNPPARAAS